jgi:hypothetical protein
VESLVLSAHKARADRFTMALALCYRCGSAEGLTLNVSRSGALVHSAPGVPLPAGRLQFVLALPPCGIVPLARIKGTGRVVRVSRGETRAFALAIERYRFVRPDREDPDRDRVER